MVKNILLTGAATLAFVLLPALASAQSEDAGLRHVGRHIPGLADDDIVRAKALEPVGDDFRAHLAREYQQLVIFETDEMHDWRDADYYAEKVMALGDNKMVSPELVEDWEIEDPADAEALGTARGRLIAAFDKGAKTKLPADTAVAQASYDCWIEQQEENFQLDHIEACKKRFEDVMARIEAALKPKPKPAPAPKTEWQQVSDVFTVYFDFDSDALREDARQEIDRFVASLEDKDKVEVAVTGHADRAGSNEYNMALSQRRADNVRAALIEKGLKIGDLEKFDLKAVGESEPAVATEDNVREQANRRVELRAFGLVEVK